MRFISTILTALASLHAIYLGCLQKLAARLTSLHGLHRQRGVTALEYVLIVAVVVLVIIAAMSMTDIGTKISSNFSTIKNDLSVST